MQNIKLNNVCSIEAGSYSATEVACDLKGDSVAFSGYDIPEIIKQANPQIPDFSDSWVNFNSLTMIVGQISYTITKVSGGAVYTAVVGQPGALTLLNSVPEFDLGRVFGAPGIDIHMTAISDVERYCVTLMTDTDDVYGKHVNLANDESYTLPPGDGYRLVFVAVGSVVMPDGCRLDAPNVIMSEQGSAIEAKAVDGAAELAVMWEE